MIPSAITNEIWKPVVGFEGLYEVSSLGRVRSLPKLINVNGGRWTKPGRLLKTALGSNGYIKVTLTKDRRETTFSVHVLVAEAFIGPRPDGCDVRHLNGSPIDNREANLCYGTPKENCADRTQHWRGKKHWRAALEPRDIKAIKTRRSGGEPVSAIAAAFGVSKTHIYRICAGQSWGTYDAD